MRWPPTPLRIWQRLAYGVLVSIGWIVSVAVGQGPTVDQVQIGVGGLYKVGHWTPVQVELLGGEEDSSGRLRLHVTDGNGLRSIYESEACQVPAGQSFRTTLYARFGQPDGGLLVEFLGENGVRQRKRFRPAELPDAVRSWQRIVISVGQDVGVADALRLRPAWLAGRVIHANLPRLDALPLHWLGYGGVDVLVVASSQLQWAEPSNQRRWQSLTRWTQLGGSLLLIAASQADTLATADQARAPLLPGVVEYVTGQRETTGIEQYAAATQRLDQAAGATEFQVPMSVLKEPRGIVEVFEGFGTGRIPAVMRHGVGLGRVTFVAFDLDQSPFREWTDRPRLVARLLSPLLGEQNPTGPQWASENTSVESRGAPDLLGQLRVALDQFERVRLVPFSLTAGLIAVYLLLIGPLDYWWLKRKRRMEWTWLTFPLIVLAFLGLVAGLAYAWKGGRIQIHQAEVVDLDVESGWMRGHSWVHFFSPRTTRLDPSLQVHPDLPSSDDLPPQRIVTWQGFPGDRFGEMDSNFQRSAFTQPYRILGDVRDPDRAELSLEGFPIAVWSSRGLLGRWWSQVSQPADPHSQLTEGWETQLTGSFSSPLSEKLFDAHLLYDRWVYPLGTVPAGEQVLLANRAPLDLRSWLTQRRVVNGRNVTPPWNQRSTDVARIMQLIMFYEAANGRSYTQHLHDYDRTLDLSDQLRLRRAILLGRASRPASQTVLPQAETAVGARVDWTYYRILLPVQEGREDSRD